jgi:hypothetical protein
MRFALTNLIDEVYGLDLDLDMENMFGLIPNDDGRKNTQPWKTVDSYRFAERSDVPLIAMSHRTWDQRFDSLPIVLLMRTPADSLVSRFYHMSRHAGEFNDGIDQFARDPRYGVPSLVEYFASWEPHSEDQNVVAVTYEQLRSDPLDPFGRIVAQMGIDATQEQLERALELSNVDRMREVERKSGVGQPNDYDRSDPQAMRVRSGRVGGWRDELSPQTSDYLFDAVSRSEEATALLERYSIAPQLASN